ncbi:hypothetical protein DI272_18905 [Streptomyces sp. Act143]|uniref:hypothetical protein n=1 Tax=Streptomyces sp. Act143 TaxID=2200760 RepID=UPI000D6819D5|nr:hypothetical protein [Streptomyces sp. Act143]PWI16003.1 hypothetical protein DI272_18905 [Streptomyces sp. Act143]
MATTTARKPITPTALDAGELADFLTEQAMPLRALFHSGNPDTATGSQLVHDGVFALVRALRAGEIAPVVAQVRLIGINRTAARYWISGVTAHRTA